MARILSHPFRVEGGRVATVEQDGEQGRAEQLAVLCLTRQGERDLVPLFGLPDPAFQGVAIEDVVFGVTLFGPPVQVEDVLTVVEDPRTQEVTVSYV